MQIWLLRTSQPHYHHHACATFQCDPCVDGRWFPTAFLVAPPNKRVWREKPFGFWLLDVVLGLWDTLWKSIRPERMVFGSNCRNLATILDLLSNWFMDRQWLITKKTPKRVSRNANRWNLFFFARWRQSPRMMILCVCYVRKSIWSRRASAPPNIKEKSQTKWSSTETHCGENGVSEFLQLATKTHRGRTIRKMYGAHLNAQDAWLRNSYSTIICSFCLPNMGAKPAPTTSLTRNCWMCCQLVATSPQMVANHHQTSIAWEHKAIKPFNH